jgi:hypothetical protein
VPAVAAVGVLGALVAVPYLRSLGSPAPAAAAGQAAAAAAGQGMAATAGHGMASLSVTSRTANAARLPSSVRAAGNQYWAQHAAATNSPEKPAAR